MKNELVRYDAMCRAISDALEVDEVKKIRDRAAAIAEYARQAKNREAERQCEEIRVRAEARWGDLWKAGQKSVGGRPKNPFPEERSYRSSEFVPTLKDMGVSYKQSHEWQRLSEVPKDQFEDAIASLEHPSAAAVLEKVAPKPIIPVSGEALLLSGVLYQFEKEGWLDRRPKDLMATMVDTMAAGVVRRARLVSAWLAQFGEDDDEEDRS